MTLHLRHHYGPPVPAAVAFGSGARLMPVLRQACACGKTRLRPVEPTQTGAPAGQGGRSVTGR